MKVQNLTTLVAKITNKKGWAFFGEWRVPKNHRCRGVLFSGSVQDSHNNFVNLQPIVWLKFCKTMKEMFRNCYCLTRLYLSSFDMSNVKDTTNMFYNCPAGADWQHLLN